MGFQRFKRKLIALCKAQEKCWCCIFRAIHKNKFLFPASNQLSTICEIPLDNLLECDCPAFHVVLKIVKTYNRMKNWNSNERITINNIEYIMAPLHFEEVGVSEDTHGEPETSLTAFQKIDVKLTRTLVKYGIFKPGEIRMPEPEVAFSEIAAFRIRVLQIYNQASGRDYFENFEMFVAHIFFGLFDPYTLTEDSVIGHAALRFKYILIAMETLLRTMEGDPTADSWVQCSKMYFRTIIEPYVSKKECQKFLCLLLNEEEECKEIAVFDFGKEYSIVYGEEGEEEIIPRNLMHYCRYSIRRDLSNRNRTLPSIIKSLIIPHTLKEYLLAVY